MKKQLSLLVISLTVFMVVFTNLTSIAQESSVRIDSDTLFINGDKVARYQIGEVKGKAVTIETFFFEKDGNQVYSNYLKLFEHRVRQDLQGRGLFKGYKFYFAYGFNEVISPEYVGIPESAEMDTSGTVSFSKNQLNEPRTPGQHLSRAGRSFNGALAMGIGLGVLTPLLATTLGATGTLVFGGIGGAVILILYIDGNSSLIRAGEGLDRKVEKP